jgi:hypothetical protein
MIQGAYPVSPVCSNIVPAKITRKLLDSQSSKLGIYYIQASYIPRGNHRELLLIEESEALLHERVSANFYAFRAFHLPCRRRIPPFLLPSLLPWGHQQQERPRQQAQQRRMPRGWQGTP